MAWHLVSTVADYRTNLRKPHVAIDKFSSVPDNKVFYNKKNHIIFYLTYFCSINQFFQQTSYFAIFDGFNGNEAAKYSAEHLHRNINDNKWYTANNLHLALERGFAKTNDDFMVRFEHEVSYNNVAYLNNRIDVATKSFRLLYDRRYHQQ